MRKPKWTLKFYKTYGFRKFPTYQHHGLLWKDKFESPRCEAVPMYCIEWLRIGFYAYQEDDPFWEQWLWIHRYNDGNEQKAKETWGWKTMDGKSTWEEF